MTPTDKLYIFSCGHAAWNPPKGRGKQYRCPKCESKLRCVLKKCIDCNAWMVLSTRASRRMRCKVCSPIHQKILLDRANRSRDRSKTYTSVPTLTESHVEYIPLQKIADEFGVTKERARQITINAMTKFKRNWERMHPDLPNPIGGMQ